MRPIRSKFIRSLTDDKSKASAVPLHQRHRLLLQPPLERLFQRRHANSPFQPTLENGTSKATAALNSFYTDNTTFCTGAAPEPSSAGFCFNGTPLELPQPVANTPPTGICLERLDNAPRGYYLNLVPQPGWLQPSVCEHTGCAGVHGRCFRAGWGRAFGH